MPAPGSARPSKVDLEAARGRTVPDVLAPALEVVFVGINPGLVSAAVGHHFARPGNRFWKALHRSGFTDRVLSPFEDTRLLEHGLGLTNLVEPATATADEVAPSQLRAGVPNLSAKIASFAPRMVAVLGVGAYRIAFERPRASFGPQDELIAGSRVWVLPNPSGLNARYQVDDLAARFRDLRAAAAGSVSA